jgi:hypothetical protein
MRLTALKLRHLPVAEAAAAISRERMNAWSLDAGAYPAAAERVAAFTPDVCFDART